MVRLVTAPSLTVTSAWQTPPPLSKEGHDVAPVSGGVVTVSTESDSTWIDEAVAAVPPNLTAVTAGLPARSKPEPKIVATAPPALGPPGGET